MRVKRAQRWEYGEKKAYMNNAVTPTAQAGLDAIATSFGISRSELLERIGRGILIVQPAPMEQLENEGDSASEPLRDRH